MRKAALLATLALAGCSIGSGGNDDAATGVATSAPTSSQSQAAAKLGFPTVATRNTIRVGAGRDEERQDRGRRPVCDRRRDRPVLHRDPRQALAARDRRLW